MESVFTKQIFNEIYIFFFKSYNFQRTNPKKIDLKKILTKSLKFELIKLRFKCQNKVVDAYRFFLVETETKMAYSIKSIVALKQCDSSKMFSMKYCYLDKSISCLLHQASMNILSPKSNRKKSQEPLTNFKPDQHYVMIN